MWAIIITLPLSSSSSFVSFSHFNPFQSTRPMERKFGDTGTCEPLVSIQLPYVSNILEGLSCSWSYGSWIYNYLCNHCLSPQTLRVQIPLNGGVHDTALCDKVCQWFATGQWFFPCTPVFSTKKTDRHNVAEKLLKVALNTITLTPELQIIFKSKG